MTIPATPSQITYTGDGSSVAFPIPYVFDVAGDITVIKTSAAGIPSTLATGYSITGGGGSTGTCTMTSAPAIGETLTIFDDPDLTQTADYISNDSFPAEAHEGALDRTVRLVKRLHQRVNRSIRVADGDLIDGDSNLLPISSSRAGLFLAFDAQGRPTAATGTGGGDAALRTDLAKTTLGVEGARLVGTKRTETGAVAASVFAALSHLVLPVMFGVTGDGSTNDASAMQNAINASGNAPLLIPYTANGYRIDTPLVLPDRAQIMGYGRPKLFSTVAGKHVIEANGKSQITIDNVRFQGLNSSTVPLAGVGGYGAAATGLVTLVNCTDFKITNNEFTSFYNGVSAIQCTRGTISRKNYVSHWLSIGILFSNSAYVTIDDNDMHGCDQVGAVVAYGCSGTGDEAGGFILKGCSFTNNRVSGVKSWDGFMSHDCDGLIVAHNDFRDVRTGVDIGHFASTNKVRNVRVVNNYIESTTTNTYGATPAQHAGIAIAGFDASNRVATCVVQGNEISGFFQTAGMTLGGNPSHISIGQADDVTCTGNVVTNGGTSFSNAGVLLFGTVNGFIVQGNQLRGTFALGAVRGVSITTDGGTIGPNNHKDGNTANNAVALITSTGPISVTDIGQTNSTAPFSGSATLTFTGSYYEGSATYDPPSLADGAGTTTTVTVTGAALGDFAEASFGGDTAGITITAWISAANTMSVRFQNESGGVLDIGSSTLTGRVWKKH